jgi:hypothetical protein
MRHPGRFGRLTTNERNLDRVGGALWVVLCGLWGVTKTRSRYFYQ